MASSYTHDKILVARDVRIVYPNLFSTAQFEGKDSEKYQCVVLLEEGKHADTLLQLEAAAKEVSQETSRHADLAKVKNFCLSEKEIAGYEGPPALMLRLKNRARPAVVGPDLERWSSADKDKIYGGCYVNVSFKLWGVVNKFGQTISGTLCGVQFVREGDVLGGEGPSFSEAVAGFDAFEDTAFGGSDSSSADFLGSDSSSVDFLS